MISINQSVDRRKFLQSTALLTSGALGLTILPASVIAGAEASAEDMSNIIGPWPGYAPQVGTLVSMMTWMRECDTFPCRGTYRGTAGLVHDAKANSIGAMLLHLAATERFYQLPTFENKKWGSTGRKPM